MEDFPGRVRNLLLVHDSEIGCHSLSISTTKPSNRTLRRDSDDEKGTTRTLALARPLAWSASRCTSGSVLALTAIMFHER